MWTPSKSKAERQRKIKALLNENDRAVLRGVVAIYSRQTEAEKCANTTHNDNNIGFSAFDAKIMTAYAKLLLDGKKLSEKQFEVAKKRILRYSRQLAEIAESREQEVPQQMEL